MACALFLSILSGRCDLPAGRHVINLIFPPGKEHPVANRAFPVKVRRKIRLLTILLVKPSLIPAVACSGKYNITHLQRTVRDQYSRNISTSLIQS